MVLKTQICRFSGFKVYPGSGILYIRVDGSQNLLLNRKIKQMFVRKKKPQKIAWTVAYRKAHKKDKASLVVKKKVRAKKKLVIRGYGNLSSDEILKKRNEKPEVRKASRDAALREIKERMKKKQDAVPKKAAPVGAATKKVTENIKAAAPRPSGAGVKVAKGKR